MRYHFIGIGGSGMSAIAQILHDRGETVSGSDRQENDATGRLRAVGVKVTIGHSGENINGAEVVVYTPAVPADNPELTAARRLGVPVIERPAILGRIMDPYTHRVAVSGTHGKTTTTSMISAILQSAGLDATILVGADVAALGGNARLGGGSIAVAEACEAFESFLHLHPSIAVITNIDADHLDYYGTIDNVQEAFRQFLSQVDDDGCVIGCWDDERVRTVCGGSGRRVVSFGLTGSPDVFAADVDVSTPNAAYSLVVGGEALGEVRLGVPGRQNVVDSLAAAAAAFELGASFNAVRDGLRQFRGAGRRFEVLYDGGEVMVVDDYAHHPTEVAATLTSARGAYRKRIVVVFQPHLYSRTRAFAGEFAEALALADEVIVTSIYAARELPIEGVTAEMIVDRMKSNGFSNVRFGPDKETIAGELLGGLGPGDMVITIGAGDVREVGEELADRLRSRA